MIRVPPARRRVLRCFLGRLGDGVDPTLRVVRVGDKFRFGVLFIDVLNPRPEPGGGTAFRNIHAGFFTVVFLPFPDIPTLLIHYSGCIAAMRATAMTRRNRLLRKPTTYLVRNARFVFMRTSNVTPCL